MAIDNTKLVINSDRFANGKDGAVTLDRLGVDDGNDFTAGDVVRSTDGVVRAATDRESGVYSRRVSEDSGREAAKADFLAMKAAIVTDLGAATSLPEAKAAITTAFARLGDILKYLDMAIEN